MRPNLFQGAFLSPPAVRAAVNAAAEQHYGTPKITARWRYALVERNCMVCGYLPQGLFGSGILDRGFARDAWAF